jgi:ZIP family zinc transporter
VHENHIEQTTFRRWGGIKYADEDAVIAPEAERLPWALMIAVTIDSGIDGLLCGLAYIAKPQAGMIMAFATCIEMGFLGLAYAASVQKATSSKTKLFVSILVPPFTMLVMGAAAGAGGDALTANPPVFLGFVTFSIVALLFLVTQELLISAHEGAGGDDLWYVTVWVFLGLAVVVLMEKLFE